MFILQDLMNSHIALKIATSEDAPMVAGIGRETFYETWREVNTEEDMQLYLKDAFDEEKIRTDIVNTRINLFLVAADQARAIGYVKMRRDRTYDEFKNEKAIEIERIYVRKEFQEQKIGTMLMDRCIAIAKSENNRWLWLAVNDENEKAIKFYQKYGFKVFGTKKFKLGTAEDEDFLMKLAIG